MLIQITLQSLIFANLSKNVKKSNFILDGSGYLYGFNKHYIKYRFLLLLLVCAGYDILIDLIVFNIKLLINYNK